MKVICAIVFVGLVSSGCGNKPSDNFIGGAGFPQRSQPFMQGTNELDGLALLASLPVRRPLSEEERTTIAVLVTLNLQSGSYGACVEDGQFRLTVDPDGLCRIDMTGCTVDFLPYNLMNLPVRSVTFPTTTVTEAWGVLKRIKTLETINGIPSSEFFINHKGRWPNKEQKATR